MTAQREAQHSKAALSDALHKEPPANQRVKRRAMQNR